MGFYFQLEKRADTEIYQEQDLPIAFWILYAIAGFALACMGLAANTVMADLIRIGGTFDRLLIVSITLALPLYAVIGLRLWKLRKRILFYPEHLKTEHTLGRWAIHTQLIPKPEVQEITLQNHRPSSNLAPAIHDHRQYHIQGHWRCGVKLKDGRIVVLDRHTERAALQPLHDDLTHWLAR